MEPRPLTAMRRGQYHPFPASQSVEASLPSTPPSRNGRVHAVESSEGRARNQSWSSVTRDSVVDNLLSSFERMGAMDDDFDRSSTSFTPPRAFQRLQQRVRGHTYSSSLSHESDNNSQESQRTARNDLHSRGSTVRTYESGADYGYGHVLGTTRLGSYSNDQDTQGTPEVVSHPILDRGRPVPSVFSAYDAHCPEPRVPGGPSKARDVKGQATLTTSEIPQSIRDQALEFVRQTQTSMRAASPSARLDHAASVTSVSATPSLHKQPSASDAPKDRPGFFRRVFGSAARANSFPDHHRPYVRDNSIQSVESNASSTVPQKTQSNPVEPSTTTTATTTTATTTTTGQVVNKKPSFFRRRKKSNTDMVAPPALPTDVFNAAAPAKKDMTPPVSPGVSSLRMVMDQYLANPEANPGAPAGQVSLSRLVRPDTDDDDDLDMFHSGYTPPPDASLKKVEPLEPRTSTSTKSATPRLQQKPFKSPKLGDASDSLHVVTDSARPDLVQANSFLADSSDVDDGSGAPSIVSAVSETYVLPDGNFSPISPMAHTVDKFVTADAADSGLVSPMSHAFPAPPNGQVRRDGDGYFRHASPPAAQDPRHLRSPRSDEDSLSLPIEGARAPRARSASDKPRLPSFQVDGNDVRPSVEVARGMLGTIDEPTADERERAQRIYDGDEQQIPKQEAAPWLGEKNAVSARTLTAYMELFDFTGRNILSGMRTLCDRLVLKGETQQVDRILDAFSRRWDECNSNNGFKGPSVVHATCYALLLLNTDQHLADIQHKMTRSEFIKNTMPAIRAAAESTTVMPNRAASRPSLPWQDSAPVAAALQNDDDRGSVDFKRSMKRLSYRPGLGRFDTDPGPSEHGEFGAANYLVNFPFEGSERAWLLEVESVLKAFYNSIVAEALPLHGSQNAQDNLGSHNGGSNLSVAGGTLRRTGSIISKAPSEGFSYRSRRGDNSALSSRWNTKNRTRQKAYPASTVGSTRTSIDDGQSAWSPSAQSSMWSKISMGKTQTTMSVESFAVHPDFKQSLGFTNALSQAIIREEGVGDTESVMKIGTVLEDESLELAGAPWAKEGMVKHKHHLEGPEKKAKERSWNECFAVVEKGYLHLFSFNRSTTKISNARGAKRQQPSKAASVAPSVVGGGNWTDNAEELGQFLLRQTLATVLPAPGYSKTRPHVWALSLPTGAVHLFQVGTAEIAEEFVSTANYWSARLSKEPLVGGVDNIEYGWSENIINPALVGNSNGEPLSQPSSRATPGHQHSTSMGSIGGGTRPSMQSSIRGSFDQSFGSRSRLPGDRAHISDWKPPAASMLPSQLLEIDQLRSLKAYVTSVEEELERHNELRNAVNLAYSSRSGNNWNKVTANWEKKSAYLLREVVKFSTYIDALERAGREKERVYEERRIREEERATSKDGKKENVRV